jgi:hypothetical protein
VSRSATIILTWADGDYTFRLAWGELAKLQEATDAGPFVVLNRLQDGTWRIEDISSVIRLGLIGGGLEPIQALKLTRSYVESRPPLENVLVAVAVLQTALMGAPDEDDLKKNEKATPASDSTPSPTENSTSASSTAAVQ